MNLRLWLKANRYRIKEFSVMVDYSPAFVSNVLCGRMNAGRKFKEKVNLVTKGEVPMAEWDNEQCKIVKKRLQKI